MSSERNINFKKIRKKLEQELDEERFEHTLGVAKTAQYIACLHGYDPSKAYLAGLLHDCAKNLSTKEKIKLCEKDGIEISDIELQNPSLLHAKAGSVLARKDYGVEDEDVLMAIRSHTTGRPDMSELEKITFIADYIEPGRISRPGLSEIRQMIFNSLDECVLRILSDTLEYLSDSAKAIDSTTKATYDFYFELLN